MIRPSCLNFKKTNINKIKCMLELIGVLDSVVVSELHCHSRGRVQILVMAEYIF